MQGDMPPTDQAAPASANDVGKLLSDANGVFTGLADAMPDEASSQKLATIVEMFQDLVDGLQGKPEEEHAMPPGKGAPSGMASMEAGANSNARPMGY